MTMVLLLSGDDSVLHVILRLSKLGVVAVEGHLILLVGSQLVGYVLGLAVSSFEHQHQTGIAVVVALHALVAHHVLSLQAEIVLNVHGCDLELVGDGVGFQQSIENTVQCIRAVLGSIVHNSGCGGTGSGNSQQRWKRRRERPKSWRNRRSR